jgi:micrococcal nuclease
MRTWRTLRWSDPPGGRGALRAGVVCVDGWDGAPRGMMARRGRRRRAVRRGPPRFVREVMLVFVLVGVTAAYGSRYLGWGGGGAAGGAEGVEAGDELEARVERVVDGDTIIVRVGGRRERLRYIGMDTPETKHPRKEVQPFGPEADAANRRLVGGQTVRLVFDAQARDKYGRLLAYVYLDDGTFVNAELVRLGLARVMTIPPNVRHAEEFVRLQRQARAAGRGMWAADR